MWYHISLSGITKHHVAGTFHHLSLWLNLLNYMVYGKAKELYTYQSCRRTVRSSRYMVFDKKSMPIVAWIKCPCIRTKENEANIASSMTIFSAISVYKYTWCKLHSPKLYSMKSREFVNLQICIHQITKNGPAVLHELTNWAITHNHYSLDIPLVRDQTLLRNSWN